MVMHAHWAGKRDPKDEPPITDTTYMMHRALMARVRIQSDAYEKGVEDAAAGTYQPFSVFRVTRDSYQNGYIDGLILSDPTRSSGRCPGSSPSAAPF